jgi:dipeptidyl aminopeptidase/acylaminoacyl peptidase
LAPSPHGEGQVGRRGRHAHDDEPDSSVAHLIGGPVQKNKEKAAKASPVTYVTKDAAPFLIMHGDQDDVVPLAQA